MTAALIIVLIAAFLISSFIVTQLSRRCDEYEQVMEQAADLIECGKVDEALLRLDLTLEGRA